MFSFISKSLREAWLSDTIICISNFYFIICISNALYYLHNMYYLYYLHNHNIMLICGYWGSECLEPTSYMVNEPKLDNPRLSATVGIFLVCRCDFSHPEVKRPNTNSKYEREEVCKERQNQAEGTHRTRMLRRHLRKARATCCQGACDTCYRPFWISGFQPRNLLASLRIHIESPKMWDLCIRS